MSTTNTGMTTGEPQKHIPAQILIQSYTPRITGFLRKRGKRERLLENLKFAKSFLSRIMQWRQRFVVVANGCLYVYVSETSSRPLSSFSLIGYNRLYVMESEQSPWTFRVAAPYEMSKIHFFACHADEDRKKWMAAIREEMLLANGLSEDSASAGSLGSGFYGYIQRPIFDPPDAQEDSDTESDNSDYDKIDDEALDKFRKRPTMPLPPTPAEEKVEEKKAPISPAGKIQVLPKAKVNHDYVNKPKKQDPQSKPAPKPKPKPKPKPTSPSVTTPTETDYFFPVNDREKALTTLRNSKEPGTYLVRKSRAGDTKVLAVYTEEDVKEYKIVSMNGQVTINNRDFYKSVNDLVSAHQTKPLPNRTTTLTRAFSALDVSKPF